MRKRSKALRLSAIVVIAVLTVFLVGSGRKPESRPVTEGPAVQETRKLLGAVPAAEAAAWQARAGVLSELILKAASEGR